MTNHNENGIYGFYLHNTQKSNIGAKSCVVDIVACNNNEGVRKLAN